MIYGNIPKGKRWLFQTLGKTKCGRRNITNMTRPSSYITSGGAGTMGFALPAAIGAKFAKPDANVWVICGDGGFQMTQAELSTAAQEGIKINIAIINNGYLGMVRQWQEFFYDRRYSATPMRNPDFRQNRGSAWLDRPACNQTVRSRGRRLTRQKRRKVPL